MTLKTDLMVTAELVISSFQMITMLNWRIFCSLSMPKWLRSKLRTILSGHLGNLSTDLGKKSTINKAFIIGVTKMIFQFFVQQLLMGELEMFFLPTPTKTISTLMSLKTTKRFQKLQ